MSDDLKNGMRLREAGAKKILEFRGMQMTYQEIASIMQVSIGTVASICKGRSWKCLQSGAAK